MAKGTITRIAGKANTDIENLKSATKQPPSAVEVEMSVLGAMLIDENAVPKAVEVLKPDSFFDKRNRTVFEAMSSLYEANEPIDTVSVYEELKKSGKVDESGGAVYLSKLTQDVSSAANIDYHARVVLEKWILRQLIGASMTIASSAYEGNEDVFDLLDAAETKIFQISEEGIKESFKSMDKAVKEALELIEAIHSKHISMFSVPSGFVELDDLLGGFQKSDLVIVAARPSMGKTAFAMSAARNAAIEHGVPIGVFSLEMSTIQLATRLISAEARINAHNVRTGKFRAEDGAKISRTVHKLSKAPIYIDDTPAISILELRAKARRLKNEKNIGLIIVDYLQLLSSSFHMESREREISTISRSLKSLAKELNIPVVALSQLNRQVEARTDKKPMLSDLRESGCLTGDALILNSETGERIAIKDLAVEGKLSPQKPISIIAMNPDLQIRKHLMHKAFYSGRKIVFELKTKTGRSIRASANHPFLKLNGWTRLDELKVGDKVGVARNLSVNISERENKLSPDEVILLAHLIGDGCILEKQPYHYTSADLENIEIVQTAAKKLFNIEGKIVKQKNWFHLYLTSPYHLTHNKKHPITLWFEKLGLERSRSYLKKLPDALFQTDSDRISLFLKNLWATDGNISWKKPRDNRKLSVSIYYSTSSPSLAEQVQHLLLRLGIQSSLKTIVSKKGYRPMYQIFVYGVLDQLNFLGKIGCVGSRGKAIPDMIAALKEIEYNPNNDVIPFEVWENVIKLCKIEFGISWRKFAKELNMSYCGSSLFKSGVSRIRMKNIYQILPFKIIKDLSESDIYWDEIVSINELGVQDVYDATVDLVHNFLANDFIVHNSIEQDADVVLFLYRPEVYNITQYSGGDMNGESTEGIAEVIVGKQRNGPIGEVKLRFMKDYARFENLERFRQQLPSPAEQIETTEDLPI